MAKELEPKVIVGLEVGTSKVVAVVGEVLRLPNYERDSCDYR